MTEQQATSNKTAGVGLTPSFECAAAVIASRCYEDRDFAKRMREDPRSAIKEICGKELPESLTIKVHENDGRTWHLSVPHGQTTSELSDEQLMNVSGGEVIFTILGLVAATAITAGVTAGVGVGIAHAVT